MPSFSSAATCFSDSGAISRNAASQILGLRQVAGAQWGNRKNRNELVERIDVYHIQGKDRTQRIVIHYNFIGTLGLPEVEEYPDNVVLDSRQGMAIEYMVGKAG